jgi:hypothetical protein
MHSARLIPGGESGTTTPTIGMTTTLTRSLPSCTQTAKGAGSICGGEYDDDEDEDDESDARRLWLIGRWITFGGARRAQPSPVVRLWLRLSGTNL